jgi:hypothetical protein
MAPFPPKVFLPTIVLAALANACSPPNFAENPMTVAWQRKHCPRGLDLNPFKGPAGILYEATILDLGGERLYIPSEWLRRPGVALYRTPTPSGVKASHGGSGDLYPELGDGEFPGDDSNPFCLGVVHYAKHRKEDQRDPDFYIRFAFRFSSSDSSDARQVDYGGITYGFQMVRLNYLESGNPDRMWQGSPALVYPLRFGPMLINKPGAPPLKATKANDGWAMSFPLDAHVSGQFQLTDKVDQRRWMSFRQKVVNFYAWLKTPPTKRDNLKSMAF